MNCDCSQFQPLELDRQRITRRIKQSPALRKRLAQIAEHPDLRLYLFRCHDCGQFWQSGHGWNFANKEYLFQVPSIETADWLNEPFQQPAAMMIYSAQMQDFWEKADLAPTDSQCRADGCTERAIRFVALCRRHHIESMQHMVGYPRVQSDVCSRLTMLSQQKCSDFMPAPNGILLVHRLDLTAHYCSLDDF